MKTRPKLVKRHLHNRRLFTRLPRWENLRLCLWLELAVARLSCSRKLKMVRECQKTSPHHNKMEKHLRIKQTVWRAPLPAQIHPAWPTSLPYLLLPMLPLHLLLLPHITWGPEAPAQKVKQTNSPHHPEKEVRTITERFFRFWETSLCNHFMCVFTRPDKWKAHLCRWWRWPKTEVSMESVRQWASQQEPPSQICCFIGTYEQFKRVGGSQQWIFS